MTKTKFYHWPWTNKLQLWHFIVNTILGGLLCHMVFTTVATATSGKDDGEGADGVAMWKGRDADVMSFESFDLILFFCLLHVWHTREWSTWVVAMTGVFAVLTWYFWVAVAFVPSAASVVCWWCDCCESCCFFFFCLYKANNVLFFNAKQCLQFALFEIQCVIFLSTMVNKVFIKLS